MRLFPHNLPNYFWISETSQMGFLLFMALYITYCGMLYFLNKFWVHIMMDVYGIREEGIRTGRNAYSPVFRGRGTMPMVIVAPRPPATPSINLGSWPVRPLSPVSLDLQDQRIVRFDPVEREGKSTDCVICLNEFVLGQSCRVLEPCSHIFHDYCVNNWLKENRTCPLCRVDAVRLKIIVDDMRNN